ncbi:MAG: UDP-3-O-acyl-N-acetylglucosamine deacetylase [Deltaproteobacteria bacterium]
MEASFFSNVESYRVQKTLSKTVVFKGIGLHSGVKAELKLNPAPENHGITFERTDLKYACFIPAHFSSVVGTSLATTLGLKDAPEYRISTVEHLMAALYALGITNLKIELRGPEIPILDGSASIFIRDILRAGLELQPYSHKILKVLKPIKVYREGTICELLPRENLRLTTSVDFPHPAIGLQTFALDLTPKSFHTEVAEARTFGFQADLTKLQSRNLALGASVENVLAFSEDSILNPEGARFPDECVRHKLLDALGDLALCGCWIEGELVSFRGGHSIHLTLLQSLEAHRTHWKLLPAEPLKISLKSRFTQQQPHLTF